MKISNFALLTGLVYVLFWIWLSTVGHGYDVGCFRDWTVYIHEHGLRHAYEMPRLDYNPLYLEMLSVFARIQGSSEGIKNGFFTFKLYVLLFDFAGVFLAAAILRANKRPVALAWLLLINVAYLYNTLIWGQVDSIFTFFVALSVFLAAREKVELSLLSGLLAVNFKLIAGAFVPLIILLNVPAILKDKKALLRAALIGLAAQVVIFLPYLNAKGLAGVIAANETQLRVSAILSPSAYNYWQLAFQENTTRPAASLYHHISMKTWGTMMFLAASAVVLTPLVRVTLIQKRKVSDAAMFLAAGLNGLAFFFFMTGMHERYSHPLILLFGIYAMLSGRYYLYVAISLAVFLNLEKCFLFFQLHTYDTLIFDRNAIAILFLSVLLIGAVKAYFETKPLPTLQPSAGEEPSRAVSNTFLSARNSS